MEFASVVDAVRCSVDVQRGMAVRNADFVPARRIEFRVGIHLGDVIVERDGDLLGEGVNIAARLEAMAAPGGICLSRSRPAAVEEHRAAGAGLRARPTPQAEAATVGRAANSAAIGTAPAINRRAPLRQYEQVAEERARYIGGGI
jgi:class 3 adenylate cyclase